MLAVGILGLYKFRVKWSNKAVYGLLAIIWLINGLWYHIFTFSSINPVARVFGTLFIIQTLLFMHKGIVSAADIEAKACPDVSITGWCFIAFGMFIYSILGFLIGHRYPAATVFGVAPCPTVIFTLGMLLIQRNRASRYLYIIPLLWVVTGSMAAFKLGMIEDLGLMVSGVITLFLILKPAKCPLRKV